MKTKLFISGELPHEVKSSLLKKEFQVTEQSLIQTSAVPFDPSLPTCDWVFFSSKKSVHYFFAASPQLTGQKLAAIGKGTARILEKFGPAAFIGETNDIALVAMEFEKIAGDAVVLFPISAQSLRSVQTYLSPERTIDLICYQTSPNSHLIEPHELYIFTSPSNVEAFFEKNTIETGKKAISYGQSTTKSLFKWGVQDVITLESLETNTLLNTILRGASS